MAQQGLTDESWFLRRFVILFSETDSTGLTITAIGLIPIRSLQGVKPFIKLEYCQVPTLKIFDTHLHL